MKYAVSSREMKLCDRNTSEYFGIDPAVLMERASLKVADNIDDWRRARRGTRGYSVLVLSGCGNNGGDGVCTARLLKQRGYRVYLSVIGDMTKASDLLISQLDIAKKYGINVDSFSNIRDNKSGSDLISISLNPCC